MKIAVVGAAGVGKSALVNSFVSGAPFPCGFETTGGRVRLKGYAVQPIGQCSARFDPVQIAYSYMELIDTGGAERYKSLLPVYLSGAQCVLVCVNTRDPANDKELTDEQIKARIHKQVTDCAPHCTADTVFIVCVVKLPESEQAAAGSLDVPKPEALSRRVSFCDAPQMDGISRFASAHPRVAAVTEAFPFTGVGVKDCFRLCMQLVLDRDVVCYKVPNYSIPFVRDRKPSQTPLDVLLGVK